ncbi:uncharacterized protein O3C94_018926 [Discoglossus pictus]
MGEKDPVWIFSSEEETTFQWLKDLLTDKFKVGVRPITNCTDEDFRGRAAILYNPRILDSRRNNEVAYFKKNCKKEWKRIIVIFDNQDDISRKKKEIFKKLSGLKKYKEKVLLIPRSQDSPEMGVKINKLYKHLDVKHGEGRHLLPLQMKPLTVGICSREPKESYDWLRRLLETDIFKKTVKVVYPIYISNRTSGFSSEISKCTFTILYHSKNRGRVNVTNVTASLYDEELKIMNKIHEKKRVIVVIDDLEQSDDGEKKRLLTSQSSIKELACDLFLFTKKEKYDINKGDYGKVTAKLDSLKATLKEATTVIESEW